MTDLAEYFSRPDTPMMNSPVGLAMQIILAEHPGMDLEQARAVAKKKPFCGTVAQAQARLEAVAERSRMARAGPGAQEKRTQTVRKASGVNPDGGGNPYTQDEFKESRISRESL